MIDIVLHDLEVERKLLVTASSSSLGSGHMNHVLTGIKSRTDYMYPIPANVNDAWSSQENELKTDLEEGEDHHHSSDCCRLLRDQVDDDSRGDRVDQRWLV